MNKADTVETLLHTATISSYLLVTKDTPTEHLQ